MLPKYRAQGHWEPRAATERWVTAGREQAWFQFWFWGGWEVGSLVLRTLNLGCLVNKPGRGFQQRGTGWTHSARNQGERE